MSDFLKGSTETLGRGKRTKTQHRVISLFHTAVVLLDPAIQIGAAAMFDLATKDLAEGARIRIVTIASHLARKLPDDGDSATEESLGSRHSVSLSIESTRLPSRSMARYR